MTAFYRVVAVLVWTVSIPCCVIGALGMAAYSLADDLWQGRRQ